MTKPDPETMRAAVDRFDGAWKTLLVAVIATPLTFALWVGWAAEVSGVAAENTEILCAQRPEFSGENINPITEAGFQWFPPGLRCSADFGGAAGERQFWVPSWMDVAIPSLLLLAVTVWLATATIRFIGTASTFCSPARLVCGGTLVLAAGSVSFVSMSVPFDLVAVLLIVWVPLALLLAGALMLAARYLLRPNTRWNQPTTPA